MRTSDPLITTNTYISVGAYAFFYFFFSFRFFLSFLFFSALFLPWFLLERNSADERAESERRTNSRDADLLNYEGTPLTHTVVYRSSTFNVDQCVLPTREIYEARLEFPCSLLLVLSSKPEMPLAREPRLQLAGHGEYQSTHSAQVQKSSPSCARN